VLHAIERFHATYPDVILELNVSRHPYSFLGDQRSGTGSMAGYDAPLTQTWHDALLGYMGNNPVARDQAERAMAVQGASAGLNLECVHRVPLECPLPSRPPPSRARRCSLTAMPSTALLSHSDAQHDAALSQRCPARRCSLTAMPSTTLLSHSDAPCRSFGVLDCP
jgi:hypothetical protein